MASPKIRNNRKEMFLYLRIVAIIYPVLLFVGQHYAKTSIQTFRDFPLVSEHMVNHPFDIFPIDWKAMGITTYIFILCLLLLYVEYLRRRRLRTSGEHGSSAWNLDLKKFYLQYADAKVVTYFKGEGKFIKKLNEILNKIFFKGINKEDDNKNMIISEEVYMSMDTRKTMRNNNVLCVGGTGSGKTRFLIKPNLLQANCSYVITDPSGEILQSTGKFLENKGYKIKVFNLYEMEHSHCYNPFNYIRNDEGVLTMIHAFISNTTDKDATKGEPFWESATCSLGG